MTTQEIAALTSELDLLPADAYAEPPATEALDPVPVAPARRGADFATWSGRYVRALLVLDVVTGAAAAAVPSAISDTLSASPVHLALLCLAGGVAWPLAIALMRGYQRRGVGVGTQEVRAVLRACVVLVVAGALGTELLPALRGTERDALLKLVLTAVPFALLLSATTRFAGHRLLSWQHRAGRLVRRVVVAGGAGAVGELVERLTADGPSGMQVVGVCVPRAQADAALDRGLGVLGDLGQVRQVVLDHHCDAVAVTSDDATRSSYLRELSWSLEGCGIEMLVDPGLVEVAGPRMHVRPLFGFPLLHVEEPRFTGPRRVVKRTSDVVLTLAGLVATSPFLIAIALAVKLQDGGPVFFRQERIGRGGEAFSMFKFRSMRVGAERELVSLMEHNEGKGGLFKLAHDPRVTRLGRFLRSFSLDELPQLINVLNGSMSLVGPRPHLEHELAQMPAHSRRRSLVTPGMTGLWQVSGRSDLDGDRAIQLDLRYVENWSLTLDLLILWRTFSAVLRRRGAA